MLKKFPKFDTTCDEDLVKANYIKPAAYNLKTLKTAYRPSKLFPFNVIKIFDFSFSGVGKHVFLPSPDAYCGEPAPIVAANKALLLSSDFH